LSSYYSAARERTNCIFRLFVVHTVDCSYCDVSSINKKKQPFFSFIQYAASQYSSNNV
jgi:hypothetical protein